MRFPSGPSQITPARNRGRACDGQTINTAADSLHAIPFITLQPLLAVAGKFITGCRNDSATFGQVAKRADNARNPIPPQRHRHYYGLARATASVGRESLASAGLPEISQTDLLELPVLRAASRVQRGRPSCISRSSNRCHRDRSELSQLAARAPGIARQGNRQIIERSVPHPGLVHYTVIIVVSGL